MKMMANRRRIRQKAVAGEIILTSLVCAVVIFAIIFLIIYSAGSDLPSDTESSDSASSDDGALSVYIDDEPPIISGTENITVEVGGSISYRAGVTVTDNVDESVSLTIDSSGVNLTKVGSYTVTYSATDSCGNTSSVVITVTVVEATSADSDTAETTSEGTSGDVSADITSEDVTTAKDKEDEATTAAAEQTTADTEADTTAADTTEKVTDAGTTTKREDASSGSVTIEELDEIASQILKNITTSDMSLYDIAEAIYEYVNENVRYVGSSDKSSWISGAYVGFTEGKGDCFTYFACSKELLTLAGIESVDLCRVGGASNHYWQLVNVGDGWYHFDACPHPTGYYIRAFMLTEAEVRAYTEALSGYSSIYENYYVYDYESCPVTVEGTEEGVKAD